jgi:hypothetical protein
MSKREQFKQMCDETTDTLEPAARMVHVLGLLVGGLATIVISAASIYDVFRR